MNSILLVDDEQRMLDLLALYLKPHGYVCAKVKSAMEALNYLDKENVDIILLDIMMPEINGLQLCRTIRDFSDVPIIMITARDQQEDIVKGLRLGADDYITKPFDESELLARIEALIRRTTSKALIEVDGLFWDKDRFEITYDNQVIPLTPKEFLMLGHLMNHPNIVVTRERFFEFIWGLHASTEARTIDSHVRNIRDKLRKAGFPIDLYLKTVWGIGYKWVVPKGKTDRI
ncbi:response regulator transcription factor [Virgibacillus salexigens]|uniref:response regulator transcription factor n=1 Tax=Virgibacillus salexigens TaxID=61016 RepID=UPI00190B0D87|nr:response regulator transcription factor [Virgibacillus salexigens]